MNCLIFKQLHNKSQNWVAGLLAAAGALASLAAAAEDLSVVENWLKSNADVRSLKVDFTQNRALKTLKSPLSQEGTLWLDYQNRLFRWQLGSPAKTIVVSQGNQIVIIRTPLKRVEFRETGGDGPSSGSPGLSSLAKGFPRSVEEFQERYQILSITPVGNAFEIATLPLGPDGEGVSRFCFVVDQQRFLLKGLVIDLKDGSSVTTTFQKVELNPVIDPSLFAPDLTGYQQTRFR